MHYRIYRKMPLLSITFCVILFTFYADLEKNFEDGGEVRCGSPKPYQGKAGGDVSPICQGGDHAGMAAHYSVDGLARSRG
jgi:hypothetical protein